MGEFFRRLFASDFMPHGTCYFWNPAVLWLNVVSDGLITAAYYAIPVLLLIFFRKRKDISFRWIFVAFAIFIVACGTTHLMGIWTVWHGTYRLDGAIKAITAAASILTTALLVPVLPALVKLPTPDAFRVANRKLQDEIEHGRETARLLERQASLLELAHDAIIVRRLDGTILFWNCGAELMYGWTRSEAEGKRTHGLLKSVFPQPLEEIDQQLTSHGRWEGEILHTRRDGTVVAASSRLALREGDQPGEVEVMEINRDITERQRIKQQLREANEQLERRVAERTTTLSEMAASLERTNEELQQQMELSRKLEDQLLQSQKMEAIGRLAGGVAHDFNNVLTVILGYNGMVMEDLRNQPRLLERAEEVQHAAERAASLTKQLLAFSRRQILQPAILDLNEVVRNMEKLLRHVIGEDIDFATRLDPALAPVRADPTHLDQVIMNLVINSRDAMPDGGKLTVETANVALDESYAQSHSGIVPGHYVQMAVSDTGHGMSQETQRKIFEPFFTTKEVGKGTGLGLSIVYGIVKQNGGDIWVYSQVGKGTTFKVYLPAVSDRYATKTAIVPRVSPHGRAEMILLVEDDAKVRQLVEGVLREHGFQVVVCENVSQAIALCKERAMPIDLLLTDVVMPDMSGPELAEELGKLRPGLKVVYMSGYADNAVVRHGVIKPGAEFVEKPFIAETLTEKLREVLAG